MGKENQRFGHVVSVHNIKQGGHWDSVIATCEQEYQVFYAAGDVFLIYG